MRDFPVAPPYNDASLRRGNMRELAKEDAGFESMQDRHALETELWLASGREHYARGAIDAIAWLSRGEILARYFATSPALKAWFEGHVAAGTCAGAARVLQAKRLADPRRPVPCSTTERPRSFDDFRMPRRQIPDLITIEPRAKTAAIEAPLIEHEPVELRPKPTNPSLRKWMFNRVAGWPDHEPAPTEADDYKAAKNHFDGALTRDELRIIRTQETPEAWRKQGKRFPWGVARKSAE